MPDASDYRYRAPGVLVTVVTALLGLSIALSVLFTVLSLREMWLLGELEAAGGFAAPAEAFERLAANEMIVGVLNFAVLGLTVVTAVPLIMLVHRQTANAWALGAERGRPLDYSPGWAVGYFFIPIANLIRPPQVMAQNFRYSDAAAARGEGRVPPWPYLWWTCWVFAGFVGRGQLAVIAAAEGNGDLDLYWWAEVLSIAQDLLTVGAAVGGILMFRDLARTQERAAAAGPRPRADRLADACPSCGEPYVADETVCGVCGAARPTAGDPASPSDGGPADEWED